MKRLLILFALSITSLLAQAATRNVDLSWAASSSAGVLGYNMYRCVAPCTVAITTTPLNGATLIVGADAFVDTTAIVGQTYTYAATANAGPCPPVAPTTVCGSSDLSVPVTTTIPIKPSPPTFTLQISPTGSTQINLVTSTTTGVLGFNIYRCVSTAAACTPSLNTVPINGPTVVTGTSFTDTTVILGQTYTYAATVVTTACTNTTAVTATCGVSDLSPTITIAMPSKPAAITFMIITVP